MATQTQQRSNSTIMSRVRSLVDAHADGRAALTDNLTEQVHALVMAQTPDDWYSTPAVSALATKIADLVVPSQQVIVSQEDAFQAEVAAILGRQLTPVGPINVHMLRSGKPLSTVYTRLGEQYRYSRSIGGSEDEALAAAATRAHVMADTDVALATRSQAQRFYEQHTITGYRRIVHPELAKGGSCGLCIASSDRIYKSGHLMPIHGRCHCGTMPVIGGFDAGDSLNNLDLSDLYSQADSTNGRDLKKTRYQINEHGELGPVLAPAGVGKHPKHVGH